MADSVEQSFITKLYDLYTSNTSSNNILIPLLKYEEIIDKLKQTPGGETRKNTQDLNFLKRYELLSVNGKDRLIKRRSVDDVNSIIYVTIEETYKIIENMHEKLGHSGLHKTYREIAKKYANVSRESIQMFQMLCPECHTKKRKFANKSTIRPFRQEFSSRGMFNIVDMQEHADGIYSSFMIYQELQTKFCFLCALENHEADLIAQKLLNIFLLIGAPCILYGNKNREFTSSIIREVQKLWPKCFMVHGNSENLQESNIITTVQEKLKEWMSSNASKSWSIGIKFVQLDINTSFNLDLKQTPFQALFKIESKFGLSSSLPQLVLCEIQSEEDLEAFAWNIDSQVDNNCEEKSMASDIINIDNQDESINCLLNSSRELLPIQGPHVCRICKKSCDTTYNCNKCKRFMHEDCIKALHCTFCTDNCLSTQKPNYEYNTEKEPHIKRIKKDPIVIKTEGIVSLPILRKD